MTSSLAFNDEGIEAAATHNVAALQTELETLRSQFDGVVVQLQNESHDATAAATDGSESAE